MLRALLIGTLVVCVIALGGVVYGHGMSGPGMMGSGYSGSWYGRHMGAMDTGCGCCCQNMSGYYGMHRTEPLTKNDAETMIRDYLHRLGNPNLKQGKITETDHEFEVEIVTKDNSLVEKVLIDKENGWMRETY